MLAHYEAFLTEHHAKQTAHSGRSLYEHLKGTHDLLRDWGNPEHVCVAGLFHSIYGTRQFRHQSFGLDRRDELRAFIGEPAENLVYIFCVTDRPKVFLDSASIITRNFYDYHLKKMFEVSNEVRAHLLELEAANLIDQGGLTHDRSERLMLTPISAAARAALLARPP